MAEPYVVTSPAVSIRSLTASGIPAGAFTGTARNARYGSGKRVVDDRDGDGARQENERDAEEQEPQAHVLPGELRLHYETTTTGSTAIATKRSAR